MKLTSILAEQYLNGEHVQPTESETIIFKNWLYDAYCDLPCGVHFVAAEVSPEEMLACYRENRILKISTLHSDGHPLLTPIENGMFRAVHDYHHASKGFGFDATGETQSALWAMQTAPAAVQWILWSEIALQACACIHTGKFQPQKLIKAGA